MRDRSSRREPRLGCADSEKDIIEAKGGPLETGSGVGPGQLPRPTAPLAAGLEGTLRTQETEGQA